MMVRKLKRWPTTAILLILLAGTLLNLLLLPTRKVEGFVRRHPRALRHLDRRVVLQPTALPITPPLPAEPPPQEPAVPGRIWTPGCLDTDDKCVTYKRQEGCLSNPGFMLANCRATCGICERLTLTNVPDEVLVADNVTMPLVGFGTAGLGHDTQRAVQVALNAGYRLIDSAQAREWYREDLVGAALRQASINRHEIFLTSKLHPRHHGYDAALRQLDQSLADLHVNYLDLMLLHYPECWGALCGNEQPQGTWKDSWRALEHAVEMGKLRAIGVSNFDMVQLNELRAFAKIQPAIVQRNSDPFSQDTDMRSFCRLAGIQYQAYSSLGTQWLMRGHHINPVLTDSVIDLIAEEVGRTTAQVTLKWALQSGMAVIPQSGNKAHIESNLDLDGFMLSEEQLIKIDARDGALK